MAKGILSVVGKPDGSREHPFEINLGVRKAKLVNDEETSVERAIGRLRGIGALMEACESPLEPAEIQALGGLIYQIGEDIGGEVYVHMVEEDELTGRPVPVEQAAQ